jgi:hypothetical protein
MAAVAKFDQCFSGSPKPKSLKFSAAGANAGGKASMIYKATGNLRAIQILLGRTKIEKHRQVSRHRHRRCAHPG